MHAANQLRDADARDGDICDDYDDDEMQPMR